MTFPISPAELAKELGVTERLVEFLHFAAVLPCAREVPTGKWWLSHEGQLRAWREYLDPPKPPAVIRSSKVLSL